MYVYPVYCNAFYETPIYIQAFFSEKEASEFCELLNKRARLETPENEERLHYSYVRIQMKKSHQSLYKNQKLDYIFVHRINFIYNIQSQTGEIKCTEICIDSSIERKFKFNACIKKKESISLTFSIGLKNKNKKLAIKIAEKKVKNYFKIHTKYKIDP